ncbi:MAG: glycosyl hydrolase family 18 protein [Bacteroidota bacterium]
MNRLLLIAGLSVTLGISSMAQPLQKEIIGYFPSWKWSSRENLVRPTTIPYDKLTMINYAFFTPLNDGSIVGINPTGDSLYLYCGRDSSLATLAHAHGVKVVLSLGGWDNSENFPHVASTAPLRAAFAHACMDALRKLDFDGIDVDWEFPGMAQHNGTAADKQNFTLLLGTIKDSLLQCEQATGRHYVLSAALPAGAANASGLEVAAIAGILDFLNIMTYDFSGSWDELAYHNAPLFASPGVDSMRCLNGAFSMYHNTYNVPAKKINLGVPFYGHTFTNCAALLAHHGGPDTVHFSRSGAVFYDILNQQNEFTRYWDTVAQVPYLISSDWHTLVSYDDEQSVAAKAEYVLSRGARGLIIWEITDDYLQDGTTPLLDTIATAFRSTKGR